MHGRAWSAFPANISQASLLAVYHDGGIDVVDLLIMVDNWGQVL